MHFPGRNSEPCLWFLLRSKFRMLWNSMKRILVRKASGNHLMNSISLGEAQNSCLWFLLRSKSSMQRSIPIVQYRISIVSIGPPEAQLIHTKFHCLIHELYLTNHHSSQAHATYGTSCLLLAFLSPTTCHLSNVR